MSIKDYVKLGLNHHLLFANECATSQGHYDTLKKVIDDERLEILDLWVADDEPLRSKEIELIANSGKEIYYNCGNRAGKPSLAPASLDAEKKQYTIDVYKDEIVRGKGCGAVKVITNSGPNNLENREQAFESLVDFYCQICEFAPEMLIMIEPTDYDMSKCKLIGSSKEAVEICKRVKAKGFDNIASMVDMCHIPLMHETLEQAVKDTGEFLAHIHLGNCIKNDKDHKLYGDKHVALCIEGGEYGIDDLAELFKVGLEVGYFNKEARGSASIEMRTLPGEDPMERLDVYYGYVIEAWEKAIKG
ncbi:MAG: sugar phosphate isomerase/epimerase family protein [Sedimentisphaeraceae bacterium JB056]